MLVCRGPRTNDRSRQIQEARPEAAQFGSRITRWEPRSWTPSFAARECLIREIRAASSGQILRRSGHAYSPQARAKGRSDPPWRTPPGALSRSARTFGPCFGPCLAPTRQEDTEILRGRSGIAADTALRLARYFGSTRDFWMKMPILDDLAPASREALAPIEIEISPAPRAKKEN
jgi:hypothetical protein